MLKLFRSKLPLKKQRGINQE